MTPPDSLESQPIDRADPAARCNTLVITCSDFRFKTAERDFAIAAGVGGDYDLIALPGSIRPFVAPRKDAHRTTLEDALQRLWDVHGFTRIIAINHLSCRAYDDIATPENERALHTDHLRRGYEYLSSRFAGTTAEIYLAEITADDVVVNSVK